MLTTLLTTTPPHLVTLTSLLSAVKEGVAVGVSAQGMDDNSPGLSQQEFKEKPHFWSPQSPSIMLWQLDVCVKLLEFVVSISPPCLMVLLPQCVIWGDYSPLLIMNEMLFLARVQSVTSIPTRQIIDHHLHFMSELISAVCDSEKAAGI